MLGAHRIDEQVLDSFLDRFGLVRGDFALLAAAAQSIIEGDTFAAYVLSLFNDDLFVLHDYDVHILGCSREFICDRFSQLVAGAFLRVVDAPEAHRWKRVLSRRSMDGFDWGAPEIGTVILGDQGRPLWTTCEREVIGQRVVTLTGYVEETGERRTCSSAPLELPADCPWGESRCCGHESGKCSVKRIGEWRYHWWRLEPDGHQLSCHERLD